MANFKPHQKQSIITESLIKVKSKNQLSTEAFFLISFRHLDKNQGDNLHSWEKHNILAHSIEVLAGYCNNTLTSQANTKKFTIYGDFPPSDKTDFTFPKHIPEDADWARIHITGKQCLVGHIVQNIFYVVFLDKEHKFWKSHKKNT